MAWVAFALASGLTMAGFAVLGSVFEYPQSRLTRHSGPAHHRPHGLGHPAPPAASARKIRAAGSGRLEAFVAGPSAQSEVPRLAGEALQRL